MGKHNMELQESVSPTAQSSAPMAESVLGKSIIFNKSTL